jgi:hypothetical protein
MKHRVSEDCLRFLLQSMIDYEKSLSQQQQPTLKSLLGRQDSMGRTALHFMVERALHELLTYRYVDNNDQQDNHNNNGMTIGLSRGTWVLFQSLVLAYPPAIHVMDCDGNTPLVLLLLVSGRIHVRHHLRHQQQQQQQQQPPSRARSHMIPDQMEAVIFRMIQLLVATCPSTAIISRRLPRPFRCCAQHNFSTKLNNSSAIHDKEQQQQLIGDGAPNPLSYALLYQRSIETIQLLLQANQKVGVRGCMTVVSHYHEVPLHIAVTMRVPMPILDQLLRHGPGAVLVRDAHGLYPLDWCWIRHVIDWFTPTSERNLMAASRRRHISSMFPRWHEQVTAQHHGISMSCRMSSGCGVGNLGNAHGASAAATTTSEDAPPRTSQSILTTMESNNNHALPPLTEFELICDLWHRMQMLLPVIAHEQIMASLLSRCRPESDTTNVSKASSTFATARRSTSSSTWSVLHAACFVSCPIAMVRMALSRAPRRWLASRDTLMGRLPLHFAASRVMGYTVQVPVGFTNERLEAIAEPSPVPDVISYWEQAARVTDAHGQLPLHIAIDAYKTARWRRQEEEPVRSCQEKLMTQSCGQEQDDDSILELLLSHYPESLERRDGKTRLFPFQQAAAGEGASLNTIFTLLQMQPTLVEAELSRCEPL